MAIICLMECFPAARDQCNRTEGRQKTRTNLKRSLWKCVDDCFSLRKRTGVLDLKAKSLLVWIMSNNPIFSCKPQCQESTLSSWASIIVSSLLAGGRGLTASETNIPRTEIYCQAKSTYVLSLGILVQLKCIWNIFYHE